jgi:hypothetical protein
MGGLSRLCENMQEVRNSEFWGYAVGTTQIWILHGGYYRGTTALKR